MSSWVVCNSQSSSEDLVCTYHSGKYWQLLAHNKIQILFKFGPKKVDFLIFWRLFWWFFRFWRQIFHTFLKFRALWARKFNFWASKVMKIYFWAKNFVNFLWAKNGQYFPLCMLCVDEFVKIDISSHAVNVYFCNNKSLSSSASRFFRGPTTHMMIWHRGSMRRVILHNRGRPAGWRQSYSNQARILMRNGWVIVHSPV